MASEEPGAVVDLKSRVPLRSRAPLRSRVPLRSRLIQLGGPPEDLLSEDPGEVGVPP